MQPQRPPITIVTKNKDVSLLIESGSSELAALYALLIFDGGLRLSDVLMLTPASIDLKQKKIRFFKQKESIQAEAPLSQRLYDRLTTYMAGAACRTCEDKLFPYALINAKYTLKRAFAAVGLPWHTHISLYRGYSMNHR